MIKKSIIALLLLAGISACSSKAKSARDFSNAIVDKENSLVPAIKSCESKVRSYFASEQFDSIGMEGKRMEDRIQTVIDEVNAMKVPDVKGGDKFKYGYLKYFRFIKEFYATYTKLGTASSSEERDVVLKDVMDNTDKTKDVIAELQRVQKEFANANGVMIKGN